MLAAQQAEQSGLLAGNAPSGNVISVQQPIYAPGRLFVLIYFFIFIYSFLA